MTQNESVDASCTTSDSITNSGSGQTEYTWEVYVSQRRNKEKEMTSALVEAFVSLTSSSNAVNVYTAVLHKQSKGKGHAVRCIQRKRIPIDNDQKYTSEIVSAFEIINVDSVDKVYRILTEHMGLGEVNIQAFGCMKFYFQGNQHLNEDEPSQAIALYNQALSLAKRRPSSQLPKGSILMKRARAFLKKSSEDRKMLRALVTDLTDDVPSSSTMKVLFHIALAHPSMSTFIFDRFAGDSKKVSRKFRQIRYRHDLYEFALLHAVQDSLQSTQLLSSNSRVWVLAGECLAKLRKLKESNQYYRRALEIDPCMDLSLLKRLMEKNRVTQDFMDVARANGFSGDTLRLALDVAA